jgi:REP element-mobilizing transposase RayT
MHYDLDRGSHSVYTLQYHLVQVVKYRKRIFDTEATIDMLRKIVHEISKTFNVDVLDLGIDADHFHLIFKGRPTLNIPKYVNAVKTISARELRRNYPIIKQRIKNDCVWSKSYFLATTGQVTLNVLKDYVERQDKGGIDPTN